MGISCDKLLLQGAASGLDTAQAPCSIDAVASLLLWNFFRASITYYYLDFYFAVKKHNFPPPHCQRKLHTAGTH